MASTGRGRGNLKKDDKTLASPKSSGLSSNTDSTMDECLKELKLYRKPVAKDGSCLFRVVSELIYHTQAKHQQVRWECIDYMSKHRDLFESFIEGSFEHHLFLLKNPKEWGGQVEISALSLLYKRDFIVHQAPTYHPQPVTCNGFAEQIHLCYLNGNHYDAVYPYSFKSNAAFVQSLLYDLLLDKVMYDIDQKEKVDEESVIDDSTSSGWTEVKTKQSKGKGPDEITDRIMSAIPDAGRDKKIYWQIKRTLDPNLYRNVDLEVWEDNKTELQKHDFSYAASVQFKPGDLCLATIQESKDESEIVRVKIQEINQDKCRVVSEDYKNQYYVQLEALQPILNGDNTDAYRNLPGYYNKRDNDLEFQSQKRRGKTRRFRDEERKTDTITGRINEAAKRHDNRAEKDSRAGRRSGRKENEKKKDTDIKQASNKKKQDLKKNDTVETDKKTAITNESEAPVKVAQPAESAAAFWGRMRTQPPPFSQERTQTADALLSLSTGHTIQESNYSNLAKPAESQSNFAGKVSPLNREQESYLGNNFANDLNEKQPTLDISVSQADQHDETISHENINSKTAWGSLPSPIVHSLKSSVDEFETQFKTTQTMQSQNTPLSHEDTQKLFNLTTQGRLKVNAVRENILVTSAKMSTEVHMTASSADTPTVDEKSIVSKTLNNVDDITVVNFNAPQPSIEQAMPIHVANNDSFNTPDLSVPKTNISMSNCWSDIKIVSTDVPLTAEEVSNSVSSTADCSLLDKSSMDETNLNISNHFLEASAQYPASENVKSDDTIKVTKDKVKKKVSFGQTTEIVEKPQQVFTQGPLKTDVLLSQSSEPGKIILPPDHREKHMDEFSSLTIQDMQQQQQMIQSPFIPPGITYYPSVPTLPNVMFCSGGDQIPYPVVMSRDPEGKDLPEDIAILRHFFNLGVQWHYMMSQQPTNLHLSQPGLLPLPVQPQVSIRPLVMTSEQSVVRSADYYSPSSQSTESPLIDISQASLLQSRFQSPHQVHISRSLQSLQPVSFDQYELPPRLRRAAVPRTNGRFIQQRHIFNGRGIMGQGPRLRSDYLRGTNNYHG